MTRAAVFDLDGTLLDSAPDIHAAVNAMLGALDRPPLDLPTVVGFVGHGAAKLVERALAATGAPEGRDAALELFFEAYREAPAGRGALYPGVPAMLESLAGAGWRLGVCTNKPQTLSEVVLAAYLPDTAFGVLVGGDTLSVRKPDPAPLLRCLETLGVRPGSAIFVGDSETDEETAANAGVPFALFSGGYRKRAPETFRAALVFDDHTTVAPSLAGLLTRSA